MIVIHDEDRVVRNNSIVGNELSSSEIVMLDLERGVYFGLESVGASIWELIETPITLRDLRLELSRRYAVEDAQCREETSVFLSVLIKYGLARKVDVGSE